MSKCIFDIIVEANLTKTLANVLCFDSPQLYPTGIFTKVLLNAFLLLSLSWCIHQLLNLISNYKYVHCIEVTPIVKYN